MKKLLSTAAAIAIAAPVLVSAPAYAQNAQIQASASEPGSCSISTPDVLQLGAASSLGTSVTSIDFSDEVSYDCNQSAQFEVEANRLVFGGADATDSCIDGIDFDLTAFFNPSDVLTDGSVSSLEVDTAGTQQASLAIGPTGAPDSSTGNDANADDQIALRFDNFRRQGAGTVCSGSYAGMVGVLITPQ